MQIDFYILAEHSQRDINRMVCQLCEKAIAQTMQTIIYTKSMVQAQQLDDLLWNFKIDSFLAHSNEFDLHTHDDHKIDKAYSYPIIIYSNMTDNTIPKSYPFLINLSHEIPEYFQDFTRMAELVSVNLEEKQAARKRYRIYLNAGHQLTKYDL